MPIRYDRNCDFCGKHYEGYGEHFCSMACAGKARAQAASARDDVEHAPDVGDIYIEEVERDGDHVVVIKAQWNDAPKNLEDLLALTEADLDLWEVVQWQVKPYNAFYKNEHLQRSVIVPMFSSEIRFKRRMDAPLTLAANAALEKMERHAPIYSDLPELKPSGGCLLEMLLPDPHIGKLGWHREVGEDYDSSIARERYLAGLHNLVAKAEPFGISDALIGVGNDLLHTDNWIGTTTAGTPQDIDSRHTKMVEAAEDMLVAAIDTLLGYGWRVKVVGVPGNHDREETIHIARYLQAWYRNVGRVEVDAEPTPRKYHRHGNVLLGFTHGKDEKIKELPLIMATERAIEWSECQHREWHIGDIHKKKEYHGLWVDEERGVRIRHLSSITGLDAWHHRKGYAHHPASEGFVWHPQHGLEAILNWSALRLRGDAA